MRRERSLCRRWKRCSRSLHTLDPSQPDWGPMCEGCVPGFSVMDFTMLITTSSLQVIGQMREVLADTELYTALHCTALHCTALH